MKNVSLYFKNLVQGAVTILVYVAAMYLSVVLFLIALLEEAHSGEENSARISKMEAWIDKLYRFGDPELAQSSKGIQVDESLS